MAELIERGIANDLAKIRGNRLSIGERAGAALAVQPLTTPGQRGKGRDQSAGLLRALTPAWCPAGRWGPTLRFDAQSLVQKLRPRIRAVAAALVQHRCLTADQIARIGLT